MGRAELAGRFLPEVESGGALCGGERLSEEVRRLRRRGRGWSLPGSSLGSRGPSKRPLCGSCAGEEPRGGGAGAKVLGADLGAWARSRKVGRERSTVRDCWRPGPARPSASACTLRLLRTGLLDVSYRKPGFGVLPTASRPPLHGSAKRSLKRSRWENECTTAGGKRGPRSPHLLLPIFIPGTPAWLLVGFSTPQLQSWPQELYLQRCLLDKPRGFFFF